MHVIARRAKPDVAIPSIFRASLVPRDCHVALRLLAMTWYVPMPFGIGGRFMNRPYAPKKIVGAGLPDGPPKISDFRQPAPKGAGGTSRTPSPTKRDTQCRKRASTVPQYTPTMTAAPRRNGTSHRPLLSLRGADRRRGNPHLSGLSGAGRRIALQGLRIATGLRSSQ